MKNTALKGGILVALGASSYGMLTTFVKMAYEEGFTTYEVTFAQLLIGFLGLTVLNLFYKGKKREHSIPTSRKSVLKLILAGSSLGLTSIFYYLAVQYITVSIGIVLLMQSVWMGVALDAIIHKEKPTPLKVLAVFIILAGTLLATNVLFESFELDIRGIMFGLLAAASYTITIYSSNTVSTELPSLVRSKWMMLGGLIIISVITLPTLIQEFNLEIFYVWGPILALFGTILPPLFLTTGMPKLNVGIGVIITSIELPVAVCMAYLLLNEVVTLPQWLGIILILFSIVVMNLKTAKKAL